MSTLDRGTSDGQLAILGPEAPADGATAVVATASRNGRDPHADDLDDDWPAVDWDALDPDDLDYGEDR